MTILKNYCTECGYRYYAKSRYCPHCGAEGPWEQGPAYVFDEEDLPYPFPVEINMANLYGRTLWDDFCQSYWNIHGVDYQDVAIPPGFPEMQDPVFEVYFVVTEGLELKGPYLDEQEALDRYARGVE